MCCFARSGLCLCILAFRAQKYYLLTDMRSINTLICAYMITLCMYAGQVYKAV